MPSPSLRVIAASLALCSTIALPNRLPAEAQSTSGFKQYFNPLRKQGYVNTSQDRTIKKRHFKQSDDGSSLRVANRELGLFAIVPPEKTGDAAFVEKLLADDKLSGITVYVPWSAVEPGEDNYNWKPVDQILDQCSQHKKTAILYVTTAGLDLPAAGAAKTACDTPEWVFSSGVKSLAYKSADGTTHTMPIFWDKNYLAKWSNFVSEFGDRYDSNPNIQSIGITGGGILGDTQVVPPSATAQDKTGKTASLAAVLKSDYGMNERQLVEHWKYVADLFPKHFHRTHLNFEVNAPVSGKMGEESLDEISDYLVYRFGERVYLTRAGYTTGKHNFDDYRILLKFRNDTLTGVRLQDNLKTADIAKIADNALDDGISFVQLPLGLLNSADSAVQSALDRLACRAGYRIVCQQVSVPDKVPSGQPLKATFAFINTGAAAALRPERNLDKDTAASYRVALELRDAEGKPVLMNLHTPPVPTNEWQAGKPVTWDKELRMMDSDKHQLPAGEYSVWISLVDSDGKQKIAFLIGANDGKATCVDSAKIGSLTITNAVAETQPQPSANEEKQDKH